MITQNDIKIIYNIDKYILTDIQTITENTAETWQPNRTTIEKEKDTKIGKLAENIISSYIKANIPQIHYLSYDKFRTDNSIIHAPFDGLLFSNNVDTIILDELICEINNTKDKFGKITNDLKDKILNNHIYITEIKSTRVTPRHKTNNNIDLNKILNDDFLSYPKFTRYDKNNKINNLQDYLAFVNSSGFFYNEQTLKEIEKANMSHIYVRIYIDEEAQIAYIIGVISRDTFIKNMTIKKMVQYNKSEKALYLSTPLTNGANIDALAKLS